MVDYSFFVLFVSPVRFSVLPMRKRWEGKHFIIGLWPPGVEEPAKLQDIHETNHEHSQHLAAFHPPNRRIS